VASQSIAVLPFLPVVPGHSDPVLEFGMADTLISRLSGMEQVMVRPVNSVRRFGNPERDSLQAGKMLGVDAVVDGSLQRSGDELRVTARLLRVTDGAALWVGSFNAPLAGVFAMQDEICERIAGALQLQLRPSANGNPGGGTKDAQAYELYLKGRYHLGLLTATDMLTALDYFEKSVALDPDYALAWLGLASVNFRLPLAGEMPPGNYYSEAREAALRALALDDKLAEGHAYLGWVSFWSDRNWVAAEKYFQQAIRLNPNDFESRLGYAHMLGNTRRYDESVLQMRRAREINPLFPMGAVLESGFLMSSGKHTDAVRMMEQTVKQYGDFWLARLNLAEMYLLTGRIEESLAEVNRARELAPDSNFVTVTEVRILKATGNVEAARALLDQIVEKSRRQYVSPYYMAMAFQGIGDEDGAMEHLQQAMAENNPMLAFLGADGLWDPLRERPEFAAIMRKINLEEYFN
jgi:TolB-like protein/Tfp pilus assembly protein PilF